MKELKSEAADLFIYSYSPRKKEKNVAINRDQCVLCVWG